MSDRPIGILGMLNILTLLKVKKILSWGEKKRNHFRLKSRSILERLVRKFDHEMVASYVPKKHQKLMLHIRKSSERRKRERGRGREEEGGSDGVRVGGDQTRRKKIAALRWASPGLQNVSTAYGGHVARCVAMRSCWSPVMTRRERRGVVLAGRPSPGGVGGAGGLGKGKEREGGARPGSRKELRTSLLISWTLWQ